MAKFAVENSDHYFSSGNFAGAFFLIIEL